MMRVSGDGSADGVPRTGNMCGGDIVVGNILEKDN